MDLVERLRNGDPTVKINADGSIKYIKEEAADEIERLTKYENLVKFIANDYHELSYEKAQWQRDDWKKRCNNLIAKEKSSG